MKKNSCYFVTEYIKYSNMDRSYIWKFAGVLILLYVFTAGLLVPLNPGITNVEPFSHRCGQKTEINITGYNTRFDEADDIRVWLVLNKEMALSAKTIQTESARQLRVLFDLPPHFPLDQKVTDVNLLVSTDRDGAFVRPAAITITQESIATEASLAAWTMSLPENLSAHGEFRYPYRNILAETIRNTYFHVPLWFSMILIFLLSFVNSIRYLRKPSNKLDEQIHSLVFAGVLFGILGTLTGAVWAKFTWGAFWSWDVKQNMTLVCLLIYFAYFLLRQSMPDPDRRARVSAVYNMFAFIAMIPLLFVIPRLTESLHPGNGGNPALGGEDLDNTMRMVFYPAIIGWTLLGLWMAELHKRLSGAERKWTEMNIGVE
jgi:heme exporter protein C